MKSLEEIIKDVERDLVINLTIEMRHKKIEKKEARNIAKEFMTSPFKSKKELFMKLNKMSDKYWIVRKIYIKYAQGYESEKDEEMIKLMRDFMKKNDYENAIRVAKGGV